MSYESGLVAEFVREIGYHELPGEVVEQARKCLLDLAGVAAAGSRTRMSDIAREYAAGDSPPGARGGRLLFDGRAANPPAAAMANAATLDSFDGHDGHILTKGHAGAAVLPAVLALAGGATGREVITSVVLGYEIATRAGIALHTTASDYHSSGSWNAVGCAAVGARLLGLDAERTGHALGIAEYHGPRSPMMRCIDHPSMVKDGTAWGAHTGVSSALLAKAGFTGAPAHLTIGDQWADLGRRWRILEQYFKPYPVCRWAHPAIRATLDVISAERVSSSAIDHIRVRTFEAASRLSSRRPATTEEAQYSLPFPVAAAASHGDVPAAVIADPASAGAETRRLSASMVISTVPDYDHAFPEQRLADTTIVLRNGTVFHSGTTSALGGPENPMTLAEVTAKCRQLTEPVIGSSRFGALEHEIQQLGVASESSARRLFELLCAPTCT